MTHKELIKLGAKWLKQVEKCTVVVAEKSNGYEIPDLIAWRGARASILIECKASRSDFRADSKKWFREGNLGMGQTKYFLAPLGVIPADEIPQGWGLLEVEGATIQVTRKCDL